MDESKYKWEKMYTIVLVANVVYWIGFYFIMQAF